MTTLHIDFETRSAVDLKKTGVHVYAEDPTTDVWCAAYAVDEGEVRLWAPPGNEPGRVICPGAIQRAVRDGWTIVAHNANFEIAIWTHILGPRYGWPIPKLEQWRCTMAMALAMSLPGSLDQASQALGVPVQKDMAGHALMMRMARPRKILPDGRCEWWTEPERLHALYEYCRTDVEVERQLEKRLVALRPSEQQLWWLDQEINARGVMVDDELCLAAKKIVADAAQRLNEEMRHVTDGRVTRCSNVGELSAFLRLRGVETESLAKDQLSILLARDDLPDDVRRALELRQEAAKASVAKIDALLNGKSADGRARGLLQYHAASTGRWGGRRFQPQNIRRPLLDDVDDAIEDVRRGCFATIAMLYDRPLDVVADCLRGMIRAAPGCKLVAADFANIEGRVLAWLAGETWKLDAYRAYDAGSGPDLYKVAYGRSFGISPEKVGKSERQVGKVMELALGYQGGPGAFQTMARGYGVDIGESYEQLAALPEFEQAEDGWNSRGKTTGMKRERWIAAEIVKLLWRDAHPMIQRFWWDLEAGALDAIRSPGEVVRVGPVAFRKAGSFLWLRLPSGRALCYPYPSIKPKEMPWNDDRGRPVKKDSFAYRGVDSVTRKWGEHFAYGGLLAENVTQAVARDVMAEAMVRLEAAGYPVVLTVHDEIVSEVPESFGSVAEFERLMVAPAPWMEGLPIAAEGWEGARYRK